MDAEKLKQIEEIYHAALEIPPGKRELFFAEHCGKDFELRREVESLLAFEKAFDSLIDAPPESLAAEMFSEKKSSPLVGKQINQYKIIALLGAGGMGAVYLAQDTKLLRRVALKILPAEMVGAENRVQRFIHEARAASALNHPHILTIYNIGKAEDLHFIAMEFVDGETLHELTYSRPTDLKTLVKYLAQTAEGLAKAHSAGIVHRDLKPENIMVTRDGYAKILDFGLAKLVEAESELRQAQQHQSIKGIIMGTLGYMSPEQARGAADIDQRSDIFSFGCILYEVIAKRKPFAADSTVDALHRIIHAEPAPLAAAAPELAEIVRRCLKKLPAERFQTIKEVAERLKRLDLKTGESLPAEEKTAVFKSPKATGTVSRSFSEQRRQATIMFADLAALNEILDELEPEEANRIMNDLFSRLEQGIEKGKGKLEKRLSDTFAAIWGTSAVSEEDPENAIRTALQLQKETQNFIETEASADETRALRRLSEIACRALRIGIGTGTILLGKSSDTGEFLTSGAAVNTAKRLQQNAPPGKILISHETYRHVRGVFDVEEFVLPAAPSSKTKIYSVKSAKARAFRLGRRGVEGIETQLVGRGGELEKMLDALQTVFDDGEMQALSIVGEAGLGKSRLLFEFRDQVELMPEKVRVFNARATEAMGGLPFSLVRDLFSFRFEILDSDPPPVARDKFIKGLLKLTENLAGGFGKGEEAEMKVHFIGQIIGLDFSDSPHLKGIADDAKQIHARARTYAAQFFSAVSQRTPIVIYLDDLHLADDESLDFFDYISRNCALSPILILEFARPNLFDFRPHWGEGQAHRARLNLAPLTKRESRQLVEDILQKMPGGVPTVLRDLIVSNAEGNPFYIEELVKMLIDGQGIVVKTDEWRLDESRLDKIQVPTTLTGVLQARLDKLTVWEKLVLQQASVIGREFWDRAVENFGADINVPTVLESLRRKELLFRHETSAFSGANQYLFKHALLRDATYETVLLGERRKWHEKTAEWLIEAGGERADEYAATIAAHYEKAQKPAQTAEWFGRAGYQASKTHAAEAAVSYFQKALRAAGKNAAQISPHQTMDWQKNLGMAFWTQAKFAEAINANREMLETAKTLDDKLAQTRALYAISAFQLEKGENRAALESAVEAVRIARAAGASEAAQLALASVLYRQGRAMLSLGNYAKAIAIGEEALRIAEAVGERGDAEKAFCFHLLGTANMFLGRFEKAAFYEEQEVSLAKKIGNKKGLAQALNVLGEIMRLRGDGEKAVFYFDEALAIAREIGNKNIEILVLSNTGGALLIAGDFEKAERLLRKVSGMIGDSGHFILPETLRFLAEACAGQNKKTEAFEAAVRSLELSQIAENRENIAAAWRVLGLIAADFAETLTINDESLGAAECFDKALQIFSETKLEAETARTLRDFARYENKRENSGRARKMLSEAEEIFTRLEMPLETARCRSARLPKN